MFDLLKKKIAGFTQKIQETISKKEAVQEKQEDRLVSAQEPKPPTSVAEQETLQAETTEQETFEELTEEPIPKPQEKVSSPKKEHFEKEKTKAAPLIVEQEKKRELKPAVRITEKLKSILTGQIELSEKDLAPFAEELELSLLEADVEQKTATHISNGLVQRLSGKKFDSRTKIDEQLKQKVRETLLETMQAPHVNILEMARAKKPFIVLFLGPNGAGKTTSIAKLAHFLQKNGLQVIFSASDTFRAASIEQLKTHAQRLGARVISHAYGADPTAVAFDAVKAAEAKKIDVVLIDSAGRQETNKNLVQELKKMQRVIKPDLRVFVGEALSGQALLNQAKEFDREIGIDAFILTKLDTDPKGGTAISLLFTLKKPIIFFGTGQEYGDLEEFNAKKIIEKIV